MMAAVQPIIWVFRACLPQTTDTKFELLRTIADDDETVETLDAIAQRRSTVRAALDQENGESGIVAIEAYLPDVQRLVEVTTSVLPIDVRQQIGLQWSLPFTMQYATKRTKIAGTGMPFHVEYLLILLSHAMLHRGLARDILVGTDTTRYVAAAKLLHKAAGIFDYIASTLPLTLLGETLRLVETAHEFHVVMRDLCLLEAQQVAVYKAVADGTCRDGLLAKLCMDVARRATTCEQIAAKHINRCPGEYRYRILVLYLALVSRVYRSLATYFLAATELADGHHGRALAYLNMGLPTEAERAACADKCTREHMVAYLARVQELDRAVDRFRECIERENATVYFDAVPDASALTLPDGVSVARAIPFSAVLPTRQEAHFCFDLGRVPETWVERVFDVFVNS